MADSLWGDDFALPDEKEKTKKIINKINKPKELKVTVEQKIKSKTLSLEERLKLITEKVLEVLGKQRDNVVVIKDKESFHNYIGKAIQANIISIDTETNNSLDPVTCKLMGLCLYAPGEKQAYIPINHRNYVTKEHLSWQLTEKDVAEELRRILDAKTFSVTHNGKFDYEVLKCTTGIKINIDWDTLIGAKLIDENEYSYNLKNQYITKIDNEQEKYDIEKLFEGVEYADVDPDIFALYAATDSLMTDKLHALQKDILNSNDNKKILNLANNIEMPLVKVIAEMELSGMEVDQEYAKRLSKKFHLKLDDIDKQIQDELNALQPTIDAWKITKDATEQQLRKLSEKQYSNAIKSSAYDASLFKCDGGCWYKVSKSKLEQLGNTELKPEDMASPTKLGILLYDILKSPIVNTEKTKATGEDELKAIHDATNLFLCELILKRREIVKLLTTYIDSIPELAKRWPDGRVRTHFNQYGAATGRLSSSEPLNFQNIPSGEKTIRLLFKASVKNEDVENIDNYFETNICQEVETVDGWKKVKLLKPGDVLVTNEKNVLITDIKNDNSTYRLYF